MREIGKTNRFVHKKDILSLLKGKAIDVERMLQQLCDDGAIHSAYDDDIYLVTECERERAVLSVICCCE